MLEAFKSSLARDFEFHSSCPIARTAFPRAGRGILGGIGGHVVDGLRSMRQWIGRLLLGLSWLLLAMAELMLGLDGLLFGRAELSGWFILGGASMAGTLTVTAAEEIADWMASRRRNSTSKSVILLPPRCHAGLARH